MDIYCFGDSITYGASDGERGGWVDRLKTACLARHLEGGPDVDVFNLGIGGETTRMMRSRLSAELAARLEPGPPSRVTLAYGANDAADAGEGLRVPLEEYVDNLSWAIDEARRVGCEVWLLNVTPVASWMDGVRNAAGRLRSNAMVARYNAALAALAEQKSAGLIDVNGALGQHAPQAVFVADGVHPNAHGHALICALVEQGLVRGWDSA